MIADGPEIANNEASQHVYSIAMNVSRPRHFLALGAIVLCLTAANGAKTDPQAKQPQWMQEVTKDRPGKFLHVPACELSYHLSWNGVLKAGEATFQLGQRDPETPSLLLGICKGNSAGLAKRLWYYKNLFKSRVEPKSLRPISFESTEIDKKERVTTTALFSNGQVKSKETIQRKGRKDKIRERVFAYDHAHDLLSAILYLRSLPLDNGDEINMVVHPFKSAYLAKLKVLGREKFDSSLGKMNAIKIDIQLYGIDRDDLELKNYDKLKKATIWISEDAYRMPLEIRSEVFVGSVRAVLQSRKPIK